MGMCTRVNVLLRFVAAAAVVLLSQTGVARALPLREVRPFAVVGAQFETVTFANLVVRAPQVPGISLAGESFRVEILEELRRLGYRALGAESLVFEKDDSSKARFVLGGTLDELQCVSSIARSMRCVVGVTWELLERRTDHVVYRVRTHSGEDLINPSNGDGAHRLVLGAARSAFSRTAFVEALRSRHSAAAPAKPASAVLRACPPVSLQMPQDSERALAATALVEVGNGVGSAVVVSPDGFLLTANHVVDEDGVQVSLKGGQKMSARVVRRDRDHDIALLRVDQPLPNCLPLALGEVTVGQDVFAVGSPGGKDLAFSVSRGIVSGTREWEGVRFLQTDASINPGNSGGPLLDRGGQVLGVVSWKVSGTGFEGLAFGVPSQSAVDWLGITFGDKTADSLSQELASAQLTSPTFVDVADVPLSLFGASSSTPFAERGARPDSDRPRTRGIAIAARIVGAVMMGVGTGATLFALFIERTDDGVDASDTKPIQKAGFATAALGGPLFVASWIIPKRQPAAPARVTTLRVAPAGAALQWAF